MSVELTTILSVLLNMVFVATALCLGGMTGWWFRSRFSSGQDEAVRLKEQARESLQRLRELATSVAADVGEHNSQVQEINRQLKSESDAGTSSEQQVMEHVAHLMTSNESLASQLANAEQRLADQAKELESQAHDARTDALTGLTNRRGFDDELGRRFAEWQRRGRSHCLLMMDVDHFKKFNDTHGHLAGDEVLRRVGETLLEATRDMDIVTRYGGEEFAVILPDTSASEAKVAAERTRSAIEAMTVEFEGKSLKVTASEGLAEVNSCDDPASLIRRADEALYTSKQDGRNRVTFHDGQACIPLSTLADPVSRNESAVDEVAVATNRESDMIPSQSQFKTELNRRVAECHRFNGTLSVMLLQITNYQEIEQRFGAELAHNMLSTVGDFLGTAFREMDLVAQHDKSTFSAMLPGTALGNARVIGSRVYDAISSCRMPVQGEEVLLSLKLGLAEYLPSDNSESLLERAEAAMTASHAALTEANDSEPLPAGK